MSPKKLSTRSGDRGQARRRRDVARKYLEVGELAASESGAAINVTVGICVLSGIAAADSICLAAIGERYSGTDHAAAADLLSRVSKERGKDLRRLVALKPASHYGERLLDEDDRTAALRAAQRLLQDADRRPI